MIRFTRRPPLALPREASPTTATLPPHFPVSVGLTPATIAALRELQERQRQIVFAEHARILATRHESRPAAA